MAALGGDGEIRPSVKRVKKGWARVLVPEVALCALTLGRVGARSTSLTGRKIDVLGDKS